jgi:hypothetical protein
MRKIHIILVLIAVCLNSCVEPFEFETETFESALVVSGTITNEFKQHEISLTRTFMFEEDGPSAERNAIVQVLVEGQGAISFDEIEGGIYRASEAFSAQPDKNYELKINTISGRSYSSQPVRLTQSTLLDNITTERRTNSEGIDGVAILVDSFEPTGNSIYYRYEYEETYKVVSPDWTGEELYIIDRDSFQVGVRFRDREERTCYATDLSNTIILTTTGGLSEDRVTRFPVRFIKNNNYILSYRYSALVKQYVVSSESYAFFETLSELSGSESLFSQNQPGFLSGNIVSDTNADEHVIGFFDVSFVDEKRVFFNYEDFYPNQNVPPFIIECNIFSPELVTLGGTSPLMDAIDQNLLSYVEVNSDPQKGEGPYLVVGRPCGDCNELGSNQVPDFWIE